MCQFLKPTQELDEKESYSTDIWHFRCFYNVHLGTLKKHRQNREMQK